VADIEFVGDAHATMQLHRLLADQARRLQHIGLGGGDGAAAFVGIGVVGTHGGQDRHGAGLLGGDHHVGHAVLQGLELADRHAELLARLEVFEGDFVERGHDADGFGTERCVGLVDGALDQRQGATGRSEQGFGADLDGRNGCRRHVRRPGSGSCAGGRPGALASTRNSERPDAVARRHDEPVGGGGGEDHGLAAVQCPAGMIGGGRGGDLVEGVAASRLEMGQGQHQFAAASCGSKASFCAALPASRIRPPQSTTVLR
jgi:hypothetical protein